MSRLSRRARALLWPILAAIYSDTRGFQNAGRRSIDFVRGVVRQEHEGKAAHPRAERRNEKRRNEKRPRAQLLFQVFDSPVPESVRRRLIERCVEARELWSGWSVGVFQVPGDAVLEAWREARRRRPTVTWSELLFLVLDHFELRVREEGFDLGLFLVETGQEARSKLKLSARREFELNKQLPSRSLRVSIRSKKGDIAAGLASALGGDGKRGQAGCTTNDSVESLLAGARSWVAEVVRLRNEG